MGCPPLAGVELASVTIFPKVGGQDGETIQFNVNGFIYATSKSDFNVSFLCNDVKKIFFLAEDGKEMPPLLHFHLRPPIKMGTEKREHIQFRLVPGIFDDDSKKTEKDRYEDLKNFVYEVERDWSCCIHDDPPFEDLDETYEFHGIGPSKEWSVFGLTSYSLVGLVDMPFFVVDLCDIEIVNLAIELGKIDMTILFKDFKLDPLQINSIPLHSLSGIKQHLNYGNVKYYVNTEEQECSAGRVKEIANPPRKFIDQGNNCDKVSDECDSDEEVWFYYNSEGSKVIVNQSDSDLEE